MAKFCTRCGKQCSDYDMICPTCGQMLSSGGMVMKQTKSQASKSKIWIIITAVMIIIVGLWIIASLAERLLGVGGVSRQQSDADVAMLGGEYTYNRTEKVNDSIVDVFYKVDAQKELLDYTYECQLRYVKMESGWELTEKEMKLLDYEWKLVGTTWESEENGSYGNTKKYSFHIKSISKDDITVQYLIQDIRTNEIEQGEARAHLDKLTELAYIYIEDDGHIAGGDIDIESEEIPIHFAINFSEMCICYSKNLMLGFRSMTKVERGEALFDTSSDDTVEEETDDTVQENEIERNVSDNVWGNLFIEYDGINISLPCTIDEVKNLLGEGSEEHVNDEGYQYYGLYYDSQLMFFSEVRDGQTEDESQPHSIQIVQGLDKIKTSFGIKGSMNYDKAIATLKKKGITYEIVTYEEQEDRKDIVVYQDNYRFEFEFEGSEMTYIVILDTTY